MPSWEELERTVNNMEERYEKVRRRMYYSERSEMERDIRNIKELARVERDAYVQWMYLGTRPRR